MRISFVPSFNLFLILIIFINFGYFWLTSSRYSKIFKTYLSLELHLQRIRSPILKLSKSGGDVHLAFVHSLVSYSSFDTFKRPCIIRLRYRTMYECKLLTVLYANLPHAFSYFSIWVNPSLYSSLSNNLDCWSKLLFWSSFIKL